MIDIKPFRVAVASGKGGTGKTLVATNLFYSLVQQGVEVTLVDCDAEAPNAKIFFDATLLSSQQVTAKVPVIDEIRCTFCGRCHDYCNYNAIFILPDSRVIKVIESLCHSCGACLVACDFQAIKEKDEPIGKVDIFSVAAKGTMVETRVLPGVFSPVPLIKKGITLAGNSPVIIMDSPPGTSCPFIQTVNLSDYVVLVAEPTPFGLSDLKQSIQIIRNLKKSFGVIINRAGLGDLEVFSYLFKEQIPVMQIIPFSRRIAAQYAQGELLTRDSVSWQKKFLQLFDLILTESGISSYQR